jgi:hypothetical protein
MINVTLQFGRRKLPDPQSSSVTCIPSIRRYALVLDYVNLKFCALISFETYFDRSAIPLANRMLLIAYLFHRAIGIVWLFEHLFCFQRM